MSITNTTDAIKKILSANAADLNPNDEEMREFTVPFAEYVATLSYIVEIDDETVSQDVVEKVTFEVAGSGPDSKLAIDIDDIELASEYSWSTYDFEAGDSEYDDDENEILCYYDSTDYYEPSFAPTVLVRSEIVVELSDRGIGRRFLHDTYLKSECGCPVCAAKKPYQEFIQSCDSTISAIRMGGKSDGLLAYEPSGLLGSTTVRVRTDDPGGMAPIAVVDAVDGQNVRLISPTEQTYWNNYDNVKVAGVDLTVDQAQELFFSEVKKAFEPSPFTNRDAETYATGPITLYKVTGPNGEAKSGGSFTYDLPKPVEKTSAWGSTYTEYEPGEWSPKIEDVHMCHSGYHVTTRPIAWASLDSRIWKVEVEGAMPRKNDDKIVCQSIRLVEEVAPDTLYRRFGAVHRFFNEELAPAISSAIEHASDDQELPSFAVLADEYDRIDYRPMFAIPSTPSLNDDDLDYFAFDLMSRQAVANILARKNVAGFGMLTALNMFVSDVMKLDINRDQYLPQDVEKRDAMINVLKAGFLPISTDGPFGKLIVVPMRRFIGS